MADEEHVKILEQGVVSWNKWREENLGVEVDLSNANFSEANLNGADLSKANLSKVILNGAISDKTTKFSDKLNQQELDKIGMILSKES